MKEALGPEEVNIIRTNAAMFMSAFFIRMICGRSLTGLSAWLAAGVSVERKMPLRVGS